MNWFWNRANVAPQPVEVVGWTTKSTKDVLARRRERIVARMTRLDAYFESKGSRDDLQAENIALARELTALEQVLLIGGES